MYCIILFLISYLFFLVGSKHTFTFTCSGWQGLILISGFRELYTLFLFLEKCCCLNRQLIFLLQFFKFGHKLFFHILQLLLEVFLHLKYSWLIDCTMVAWFVIASALHLLLLLHLFRFAFATFLFSFCTFIQTFILFLGTSCRSFV